MTVSDAAALFGSVTHTLFLWVPSGHRGVMDPPACIANAVQDNVQCDVTVHAAHSACTGQWRSQEL